MSASQHTDAVNLLFETLYVAISTTEPTDISSSLAGSTEVAVAASTTFYCLLSNPDAFKRLIQEVQLKDSHQDSRCVLTHADLLELPYL